MTKNYRLAASIVGVAVLISCAYSTSEPQICDAIGTGNICGHYLKGYISCNGKENGPFGRYHECDNEFICSCGRNRKCKEGMPVCIKRPDIPKVPKDFIVKFFGKMKITHPHGDRTERVHGVIYQDYQNERLKKILIYELCKNKECKERERTPMKTVTKLTVKNTKGRGFIQYEITKPAEGKTSCHISKHYYRFYDFFHDLRDLSYQDQHRRGSFVYKDGPFHPNAKLERKRWDFKNSYQQLVPKTFSKTKKGSSHSKVSSLLNLRFSYYHLVRPHAAHFRVPSECQHIGSQRHFIVHDTEESDDFDYTKASTKNDEFASTKKDELASEFKEENFQDELERQLNADVQDSNVNDDDADANADLDKERW